MADTLRRDDPNLRQQIARAIGGDSKPGSIRSHLADALAGGQVEGSGSSMPLLSTMTPMGMIFGADELNRAKTPGQALTAAAGMAGPEGKGVGVVAKQIFDNLGPGEIEAFAQHNAGALAKHFGINGSEASQLYRNIQNHLIPDREASIIKDAAQMGKRARAAGIPIKGLDDQGEVNQLKDAVAQRKGNTPVQTPAAQADAAHADDPRASHNVDVEALSEGDAAKAHFIKNAMMDEGGNVPEEVAQTLHDHMAQGHSTDASDMLIKLQDKYGDEDSIVKALAANHSIPEMLSMHYDLNPEQMGKAYAMPKKGSKPTQ